MKELIEKVRIFCDERDWAKFHSMKELAIDLVTESAELLEIFRFKTDRDLQEILKNEIKMKEIRDELSDALFCILRFADLYNIDLKKSFHEKMEANKLKYPVDKVKGKNLKYSEY